MYFKCLFFVNNSSFLTVILKTGNPLNKYSKTCVKLPLKNRQNKDLKDNW